MIGLATCPLCGEPITVAQRASQYQRIQGWEQIAGIRASGKHGGSDISFRERLDEFAHGHCVSARRSGVILGQESLA